MVLARQKIDLLGRQTRVREHADLLDDVLPGPRGVETLELVVQRAPHRLDPAAHGHQVVLPDGVEGWGAEDFFGDADA